MAKTKGMLVIRDKDEREANIMAIISLADHRDIDKVIDSIYAVKGKYPDDWTMDDIFEEAFDDYECEIILPIFDGTYDELYL